MGGRLPYLAKRSKTVPSTRLLEEKLSTWKAKLLASPEIAMIAEPVIAELEAAIRRIKCTK